MKTILTILIFAAFLTYGAISAGRTAIDNLHSHTITLTNY